MAVAALQGTVAAESVREERHLYELAAATPKPEPDLEEQPRRGVVPETASPSSSSEGKGSDPGPSKRAKGSDPGPSGSQDPRPDLSLALVLSPSSSAGPAVNGPDPSPLLLASGPSVSAAYGPEPSSAAGMDLDPPKSAAATGPEASSSGANGLSGANGSRKGWPRWDRPNSAPSGGKQKRKKLLQRSESGGPDRYPKRVKLESGVAQTGPVGAPEPERPSSAPAAPGSESVLMEPEKRGPGRPRVNEIKPKKKFPRDPGSFPASLLDSVPGAAEPPAAAAAVRAAVNSSGAGVAPVARGWPRAIAATGTGAPKPRGRPRVHPIKQPKSAPGSTGGPAGSSGTSPGPGRKKLMGPDGRPRLSGSGKVPKPQGRKTGLGRWPAGYVSKSAAKRLGVPSTVESGGAAKAPAGQEPAAQGGASGSGDAATDPLRKRRGWPKGKPRGTKSPMALSYQKASAAAVTAAAGPPERKRAGWPKGKPRGPKSPQSQSNLSGAAAASGAAVSSGAPTSVGAPMSGGSLPSGAAPPEKKRSGWPKGRPRSATSPLALGLASGPVPMKVKKEKGSGAAGGSTAASPKPGTGGAARNPDKPRGRPKMMKKKAAAAAAAAGRAADAGLNRPQSGSGLMVAVPKPDLSELCLLADAAVEVCTMLWCRGLALKLMQ